MDPRYLLFVPLLAIFAIAPTEAQGATIKQTMEGSVDVTINHPDKSFAGRSSSISLLIQNNGWEDKIISVNVTKRDPSIIILSEENVEVGRVSQDGTFGASINYKVADNATLGTHFINLRYSQVLVTDTEQDPFFKNIAIPISVHSEPAVNIITNTPESIFTNAEFSFEVKIVAQDRDIRDVNVEITAPKEMGFRGDTKYTYSLIRQGSSVAISPTIVTPEKKIGNEQKIPFQVTVQYTDDLGNEKTDSEIVQLLLRPRTFLELTSDGGIWIGDFFVAPYVSVGTIVGIPIGLIVSILIKRSQRKKETNL